MNSVTVDFSSITFKYCCCLKCLGNTLISLDTFTPVVLCKTSNEGLHFPSSLDLHILLGGSCDQQNYTEYFKANSHPF
ncbi:hypothetical protein VNO78_26591 [Psophocarpus tetragonolobus]|uniref:Uncharacterized protein n=1 Tax=Psophocarpus tetragonolobus TaxID=3891 RepID=A0AAN9RZJ0_PSOTE